MEYSMDRPSKNQSVFVKGVLSADAEYRNEDDAVSTRLVVSTHDDFMGSIIEQFHNVIAIKDAAEATKDLVKGDGVSIVGKLLWLESEYLVQSIEKDRAAEIIATQARKIDKPEERDTYQMVVLSGSVFTEPEYTASMTGALTRSLVLTVDKIMEDAIEQSHSVIALDKLAVQLKEFGLDDDVQMIAQLLWLNSEDYEGDSIVDERAVEIIIEAVVGNKNNISIETRANQVERNIIDLSDRLKEGKESGAAYIQSILSKLNGNAR